MRNVFTILLLIAVLCLGWEYREVSAGKAAAEAKVAALDAEIETLRAGMKSAKGEASQPGTKANWIDDRNRNWQSSLSAGPGGTGGSGQGRSRGGPTPPPTPALLSDAQGRYWVDASGAKHYVK